MYIQRRLVPILAAIIGATAFSFLLYSFRSGQSWKRIPQRLGLSESEGSSDAGAEAAPQIQPVFTTGTTQLPEYKYTRVLVVPKTKHENTSWISEELPDVETALYIADDRRAPLHPPKNKGHEVMIYLTYIIDHYDHLPDVMIFMHSHRTAWHNNDFLDLDAAEMVRRLSSERVTREGYINLRCHWYPGCPIWLHPGATKWDRAKQEETIIARAWSELFPLDPIPQVLSGICCGQFALSRGRVQSIQRERFVSYRDWLLRTPLDDYISGRIWEYIWHYVFTGQSVVCPAQHACYCDGYGLCFGGEAEFARVVDVKEALISYDYELMLWRGKARAIAAAMEDGLDEAGQLEVPELGRDVWLEEETARLREEMAGLKEAALERGKDPRMRALEAGRDWKEGDGF